MGTAYNVTDQTNPGASAALSVDKSGNVVEAGTLSLTNGTIVLTPPTSTPTPQRGTTTLFAGSNGALSITDPAGVNTTTLSSTGIIVGGNQVATAVPASAPTAGALAETVPAWTANNLTATTSGTLTISSVWLPSGVSVGHIGFVTGTTAATGPTHWWAAILDSSFVLRATSADQLTAAIGASTWFNLAMTAAYTTTYTGRYYLGIMIATSTTQPTLVSEVAPAAAMITGTGAVTPVVGGASTTTLTAVGTVGSTTYLAPTAATALPYMYAAA